ncbi:MazG-like family protein [Streptomyces sp. NBC_01210]|uniref:MazG-like family protein n=1 Tax=Streptomyces sp. NBC_01210 TaxID=2903774 RepID=UPI002E138332|nr:MazG-like family protein [Streptomyces sp. NBC_01210]
MNHTLDPIWDTVGRLHDWLDAESDLPPQQETLLRMLKISEEVGEVAQAIIGATGQNPRKGTTHSWQDVESELCDVIITAMVALRTLTPEAPEVFGAHLRGIAVRSLERSPD